MKNKLNVFKCFLFILISALTLSGCSLMDFLSPTKPVDSYGFSGYVFADGVALSQATVSCGVNETTTDERGYYSFSGLTKVVQVQVSKEGYYFDDELVYVKSNRNDVNFEGNKYFALNGVVKNGEDFVSGAEVNVTSSAGAYKTTTNETGNFYLSNLAGKATVSASFENMNFFTEEVDKTSNFVTINSSISVLGNIACDEQAQESDFSLFLNNNLINNAIVLQDNNLTFNLPNVTPNSKIKLTSNSYYIQNSEVAITKNEQVDFNCQKFYTATIQTISGTTSLDNASVTLNGTPITKQKDDGKIVLNNLYGENTFGATLNGFEFTPVVSSAKNTIVTLVGKFNLSVNLVTDDNAFNNIQVYLDDIKQDVTNSTLTFNNVQLNSVLTILTDDYYIEENIISVNSLEDITINLFKYFSLTLSATYNGNALPQTKVLLNNAEYNLNTLGALVVDNLYGENSLQLQLDGYKFETYNVNLQNSNINAVAKKLFNLTGKVVSGEIVITDATLLIENQEPATYVNGEFTFEGLYESGKIVVTKQGYNTKEIEFSEDSDNLEINLTYNVTGKVLSGNNGLNGVTVSCNENSVVTKEDGTFTLQNLQGQSEILFVKDFYNINSSIVTSSEEIIKNSTYNITGIVTDSMGERIDNLLIILNDVINANNTLTTLTQNGLFNFTNLTSEYLLTYGEVDFTLKPNYHPVTKGGEYNFSNNGYGFGGRVTCGENNGVGGVLVTVGDNTTLTDEQGYYTFALITKQGVLTLFKQGYTFNNNNLAVNDEFDERTDVNFTCSYSVSGKVVSGETPLQNVTVSINDSEVLTDEFGNYEISNLTGGGIIKVTKQGYYFVGNNIVNGYTTQNFNGFYTAKYKVVTGGINVDNVQVSVGGETYLTDEDGIVEIKNSQIGTKFSLQKQGYNFSEYFFTGYTQEALEINCSYNITGVVFSGTNAVENCLVAISGGSSVITNASGEFAFNELVGENTISYTLQNFQFENSVVSKPCNLEIYAKYTITGLVMVGTQPLSNVVVIAGKLSAVTNGAGKFEIAGLTTRETLVLQKEGYEFEGTFEVNSPCSLQFSATYSISGFVKSGESLVEGVLVTSSFGGEGVLTNSDGYYLIKGQVGIVTLTFEKDGYSEVTSKEINEYTNNLNVNLTYSVVINFSGVDDYSGIYISVNGVRKEYSESSVTLLNLTGYNTLKFSKTGFSLTPEEYGVEGYTIIDVTIIKYYKANFTVETDNEILVSDAIIQVGTKTATSQGNGKYEATELSNKVNVFVNLVVNDENGKNIYSKRIAGPTIDGEGNYKLVINNSDYAYFMFVRGYQRLRESYAYKVSVSGTVKPQTSLAGSQSIGMTYKKVGDERIYENMNYGKGAAGVEPRVSVLTYVNLKTKLLKYEMVKGDSVKDNLTANYSCNWQTPTYQEYQSLFGISPEGLYPYNITTDTIKLGTMTNLSYNNNQYQFTMQFGTGANSPADNLVVNNYRTLMNEMVKGQTTGNYNFIKLTYTFDSLGNLKTLKVVEQYVVGAPVVGDITTDGTVNYTFVTSNDETATKIDISSNSAIRNTINEPLPQNTMNSVKAINTYILNKRRELV